MVTESRVREILADPYSVKWSVQGFGMLRTYLDDDEVERLHIWDPGQQYNAGVSTVHTHAWDFTSTIFFGAMRNVRFDEVADLPPGTYKPFSLPSWWSKSIIRAGEGGGLVGDPTAVRLAMKQPEYYEPGSGYKQFAPEIHESLPEPGTVTVIQRDFFDNRDIAAVYWREGDWVTAEPRPATKDEVDRFIGLAREQQHRSR